MKTLKTTVLTTAFLLSFVGDHAEAQDTATESNATEAPTTSDTTEVARAESMGPLVDTLSYESDGTWISKTDGNGFRLINPETPDDIRYYFLQTLPELDGRRTIEVQTVVLQGNGMSGLLYGFQDDPKQYYLLTTDRSGTIRLLHRTPEGPMEQKFSAERNVEDGADASDEPTNPTLVKFTLVEDGQGVEIFVNDESLGTFEGSATGTGGVGIVAAGTIDAVFLDFDVRETE